MKARQKSTIRDVADKAGISVTTVSLILNGKGSRFSKETQERVRRIQAELNYYPDYYARGLVGVRNNSLGIVIPNILNPFFAKFAMSIEQAAIPKGYFPQIFSVNGFHENIDYFIEQFMSGTQKGLILSAPGASKEIINKLSSQDKIPIVLTDQAGLDTSGDCVLIDEKQAGKTIASYLLSLGHKNIAIVIPEKITINLQRRISGYYEAYEEYGLKFDKNLLFRVSFNPEGGMCAARKVIKTNATAIIAINDDVALGVYRGLSLLNKKIPEDYSIVGFDGVNEYMNPSITTMQQPIEEIGNSIVDLMINRIAHPNDPKEKILLNTELKVGESTLKYQEMEN